MSTPTIAILPLDDRPPNYEFPTLIAQAAGFQPRLPPKEWLGTPWRSGRIDELSSWLEEAAQGADALGRGAGHPRLRRAGQLAPLV